MEKLRKVICRLCLKKCVDFKALEDYVTDVLDVLLLKIDLAVSEDPVMCTNCAALLIKCFDFKATCFDTHDYFVPFLDDRKILKLDLREIYKSKHENVNISDDHSVCGFCMGLLKKGTAVSLYNEEGDVMLEKLIEKYLPELDLSVIEKPVICAPCHESLKICSRFVTSCLTVEEKIVEYRKLTGADVIKFSDLLQLASSYVSRMEEDDRIDAISTEEKFCVHMGSADEQVGHENDNVKVEELKLLLNEDVEIKTEQHDFDRCLMSKGGTLKITDKHKSTHDNVSEAKCLASLKRRRGLQTHMITHESLSEITMHQCDVCDYKTKYKRNLQRHMITHGSLSELTMHQCYVCDFKTKYKRNLPIHMITHKSLLEITMHQCDVCDYKTKYKGNLQNHMITHESLSEITMHQCDVCDYETKYKRNLQRHMIAHKSISELTMHQCHICDFKTKYKRNLSIHMIAHESLSEVTMHQCDVCNFKTKYKRGLQAHMVTHKSLSEITMHQCGVCDYKTKYKRNLQRHIVTHRSLSKTTMCP